MFLMSSMILSLWMVTAAMKTVAVWQESYDKPKQCVNKQRHYSADRGLYSQGYDLLVGHLWVWELNHKEGRVPKNLLPSNCDAGEDSWEFLGQQEDQTCQVWRKLTLNTHWMDWCWNWSSSILVIWCKQTTHWKIPWCWEQLQAEGKEGVRGWDASPMQWTWTWADFGKWWGTGRPGVLQSMRSQSRTQLGD